MKKNVLLLISLSLGTLSYAQVGVNRENPHLSSDLELGSTNKTLLLNRVPNTSAVSNPVNGMMIYDLSEECVKAYQAGKWSKCLGKGLNSRKSQSPVNAAALTPSSAIVSPKSMLGEAYKGNKGSHGTQAIQPNKLIAENGR